jgi:hypothetical protein
MKMSEITSAILGSLDSELGDEETLEPSEPEAPQEAETEAPEDAPEEGEAPEAPEEEGVEEEVVAQAPDEESDGDEEEEEPGEEEPEEETPEPERDPLAQAFLDRYGGDIEQALQGAAQLERVLGRHGQERDQLQATISQLQADLQNAHVLANGQHFLNDEQRQWVEEAVQSDNPRAYVYGAIQEGQYDLARAVADELGNERPYEAVQLAEQINRAEYIAYQQQAQAQPPAAVDHQVLLDTLSEFLPEMPRYQQQMLETIKRLGPMHPLVQEARMSDDPERVIHGVLGIYEIARGTSTALQAQRDDALAQRRASEKNARQKAVVTSAQAAPSRGEAPRPQRITPGLTLEELDAELAQYQ